MIVDIFAIVLLFSLQTPPKDSHLLITESENSSHFSQSLKVLNYSGLSLKQVLCYEKKIHIHLMILNLKDN